MSRQRVEIELDVPDGYEFVDFRPRKHGEHYTNAHNPPGHAYVGIYKEEWPLDDEPYIILRRLPDPVELWLESAPAWLEGLWVYRFHDNWFVSRHEPSLCSEGYSCGPVRHAGVRTRLGDVLGGFTPPPCDLVHVIRKQS